MKCVPARSRSANRGSTQKRPRDDEPPAALVVHLEPPVITLSGIVTLIVFTAESSGLAHGCHAGFQWLSHPQERQNQSETD
jgi:hypothetical protein